MIDPQVQHEICELIVNGSSLRQIKDLGYPSPWQILREAESNPIFAQQYAHAMKLRADLRFELLDEVSEAAVNAKDQVQVQGLRLKADNIKWTLGRMNPRKYGDHLDVQHSGNVELRSITRRIIDTALPMVEEAQPSRAHALTSSKHDSQPDD